MIRTGETVYSNEIYTIMEREFGNVGKFVLEKQCRNLGIDPNRIVARDLPRLSRILSGLVSRFGTARGKQVYAEITNLPAKDIEEEMEQEEEVEETTPRLFSMADVENRIMRDLTIRDVAK